MKKNTASRYRRIRRPGNSQNLLKWKPRLVCGRFEFALPPGARSLARRRSTSLVRGRRHTERPVLCPVHPRGPGRAGRARSGEAIPPYGADGRPGPVQLRSTVPRVQGVALSVPPRDDRRVTWRRWSRGLGVWVSFGDLARATRVDHNPSACAVILEP